jgi:adenylate cyclase
MQRCPLKRTAWYGAGLILLSIYGGQVCPFLETLNIASVFITLLVIFALGVILRPLLIRPTQADQAPRVFSLWRLLLTELAVWIFLGVTATTWNALWYNFPLASGLKLLVGSLAMGLLSSTIITLQAEHDMIASAGKEAAFHDSAAPVKFISISTKFLIFVGSSLLLFSGVIFLLVFKDLNYVIENAGAHPGKIRREVLTEIVFVTSILLTGCGLIARQHARNLRLLFQHIQRAFLDVENGDLQARVPIVTRDELSHIAFHTNRMIQGLKEKEKIKTIFGKYVSPSVAQRILASEQASDLAGREVQAAILFTDIRNFTTLSERLSAPQIVEFLNYYFSKVVHAIHGADGIVDKFIGDAAMGVFGTESSAHGVTNAIDAAFAIRIALQEVNEWLDAKGLPQVDNGVGIHCGRVVAGNIGSPQRLEYTVIGDAVNTASRIEGITKSQRHKILISQSVFDQLPATYKCRFESVGSFELKGKAEVVAVFGAIEPKRRGLN